MQNIRKKTRGVVAMAFGGTAWPGAPLGGEGGGLPAVVLLVVPLCTTRLSPWAETFLWEESDEVRYLECILAVAT